MGKTKIKALLFMAVYFFIVHASFAVVQGELSLPPYGLINDTFVNLRSAPGVSSKILYQFKDKEYVQYLEKSSKKEHVGKDSDYWYKVKTQRGMAGWVFGKFITIFDENLDEKGKIVKDLTEVAFGRFLFKRPVIFSNPQLRIIDFCNKQYYIFGYDAVPYKVPSTYDEYILMPQGGCDIYIKVGNNEYIELTGIPWNEAPFYFYDFDGDNNAEIVIYRKEKRKVIRVFSERKMEDIFFYSLGFEEIKRRIKSEEKSYIELKEIEPKKSCEIIVHIWEGDNLPLKKVVYKWNGKTFSAEK